MSELPVVLIPLLAGAALLWPADIQEQSLQLTSQQLAHIASTLLPLALLRTPLTVLVLTSVVVMDVPPWCVLSLLIWSRWEGAEWGTGVDGGSGVEEEDESEC